MHNLKWPMVARMLGLPDFVVYTISTLVLGALSDFFNYHLLISMLTAVMATGALMMVFATKALPEDKESCFPIADPSGDGTNAIERPDPG